MTNNVYSEGFTSFNIVIVDFSIGRKIPVLIDITAIYVLFFVYFGQEQLLIFF